MLTIDPMRSLLLVIDFQSRLMPVIHDGATAARNAGRLIEAAKLFDIPRLFTEQNPKGLGSTIQDLSVGAGRVLHKQSFDVCKEDGFLKSIPADGHVVVAGCEAHVCVQQSVLGLVDVAHKIYVVRDAIGSRSPENKEAAIRRMERHGAEIVTTEMVVFEWLQTADHPQLRSAISLIK